MDNKVLLAITVSRDKEEIFYNLDCSSELTDEEIEYYLEEIIKGLCEWKPSICSERNEGSEKKHEKEEN